MSAYIYKLILISLCSTFTYCTSNTVYHHYNPISNDGWKRSDTIFFILNDSLEIGDYNTQIGIRHTIDYPYRDLWLSILMPDKISPDTIHLFIANERGNWNGNGTASGYYQYESEAPIFKYTSQADSIIKVWHIMKEETLLSITDIGIKISKQ